MLIEKIINDYLNSLDGVESYTEMPRTFPGRCYLIEKTGDSRADRINRATVAIKSYGESLYDSMELNEALKDAMLDGLVRLDEVAGVKLNSDYNFTDTTTKRYRYQAVFSVSYY